MGLGKSCQSDKVKKSSTVPGHFSNVREMEDVEINFEGLSTPEIGFFVGCGLDIYSECRELKFIGIVKSYRPKRFIPKS